MWPHRLGLRLGGSAASCRPALEIESLEVALEGGLRRLRVDLDGRREPRWLRFRWGWPAATCRSMSRRSLGGAGVRLG